MPEQMTPKPRELAQWRAIQEGLAKVTGLSLRIYDARKKTALSDDLCGPSQDNPLCDLLQRDYGQLAQCEAYCGRNIQQASQDPETSFFTCYAHLNVFAIPVIIDQETQMVLLGGKRFSSYDDLAKFRDLSEELDVDPKVLLQELRDIQIKDAEYLKTAGHLIQGISQALFEALHKRDQNETAALRLMTLLNLCTEFKSVQPEKALYAFVLSALGVLFDLDTGLILERNEKSGGFTTAETFGTRAEQLREFQGAETEGLFERFVQNQAPLACTVTYELLKAGFPPGITSAHLFPIFRQQTMIGALGILDTTLQDEQVQVISHFCELLNLTLEIRSLREGDREDRTGLTQINQSLQAMAIPLDRQQLLDTVLNQCAQLVGAEQGSLLLADPDGKVLTVQTTRGLNKKIVELFRVIPGEGISGEVFLRQEPMRVEDIEKDPRTQRPNHSRYRTRSFISLPLKASGRTIGVLNLADKSSGEVFAESDLQLLEGVAASAAVAIERSLTLEKNEALKKISITDPLTGLLNRRYFQQRLAEEMERSRRHKFPISLIMIDIDDFKSFNDSYGHPAGDEVLKITARLLRNSVRTIDVAARYGGEEFTVILPQTTKQDALIIADRFCQEMGRQVFHPEAFRAEKPRLTVSLGLASYPEDAQKMDELIRLADTALYSAKAQGKNQVVVFEKTA